jgi:predicted nucleotidyltransferase
MNSEYANPRQHLLHATASFVESMKIERGVLRIAVVGSILSEKRSPKDIDLLVTVADNTELDRIAAAGRRLKGTAQTKNLGADIFLANELGQYIGRTCGWKVCEFGVRMACRADNCGARKYLNDDLSDLRLSDELVKNPPLILWPRAEVKMKIPKDVAEILLHEQSQGIGHGGNCDA